MNPIIRYGGGGPSSVPLYGGGGDMTPSSVTLYGGGGGMSSHLPLNHSSLHYHTSLPDQTSPPPSHLPLNHSSPPSHLPQSLLLSSITPSILNHSSHPQLPSLSITSPPSYLTLNHSSHPPSHLTPPPSPPPPSLLPSIIKPPSHHYSPPPSHLPINYSSPPPLLLLPPLTKIGGVHKHAHKYTHYVGILMHTLVHVP